MSVTHGAEPGAQPDGTKRGDSTGASSVPGQAGPVDDTLPPREERPGSGDGGQRPSRPASGPGGGRRRAVIAVIAVLVLVGVGATWAVLANRTPPPPPIPAGAPITLPAALAGLPAGPEASDFASQPTWQDRVASAVPAGVTVVGHAYGSPKARRQIRVVAGRTDLTGKLEFSWAADAGHVVEATDYEPARCTKNLQLTPRSAPQVRPTMMFCWRTSAKLSAYAVVIDFDKQPQDADAMAPLDTVWKAALTGR